MDKADTMEKSDDKSPESEKTFDKRANRDLISDNVMKSTFNHVVDYIIAKRVGLNGKVEYLVKWDGWHTKSATWEPLANFASPRIPEIFEEGLRKQRGEKEPPIIPLSQSVNRRTKGKTGPKKRAEPMATAMFCKDLGKRSRKLKKGTANINGPKELTAKLFDVEVSRIERVIKRYEPLVGASKRKSRMSCPSSPIKAKLSPESKPKPISDRSQRYRMRHQTTRLNSDNSLSNTSLEENKNPLIENSSEVLSNKNTPKSSKNKRRRMKVNNDSNKMIKKLSKSFLSDFTEVNELEDNESQDNHNNTANRNVSEDSPSKVFINKVKDRFSAVPHQYQKFLEEVIQFQSINLEFNKLLNNNQELVRGFFDILFINREQHRDFVHDYDIIYPTKSDDEINQHITQWMAKVDRILEDQQKEKFWNFIRNKEQTDILKASPDYLWLRINKMLNNHKDLSDDFKTFMPTLCSKIYSLYSNK